VRPHGDREKLPLQGDRVRGERSAPCGCGTFTETPDWSSGEPNFDDPRISVNARLFDDFDLGTVEVVVIDGRNLW
jgi:hypothetical protein